MCRVALGSGLGDLRGEATRVCRAAVALGGGLRGGEATAVCRAAVALGRGLRDLRGEATGLCCAAVALGGGLRGLRGLGDVAAKSTTLFTPVRGFKTALGRGPDLRAGGAFARVPAQDNLAFATACIRST